MNWIIFGLLSAGFAAPVAIFGKIGLKEVDSTIATTVRSVVMAAFLIITSFAIGKVGLLKTINGKVLTYIILSGIAGALSWLFYFYALKTGPATGVVALDRLSIVFVVVLAAIFLGEGITVKSGIGAALMVGGALLMAWK